MERYSERIKEQKKNYASLVGIRPESSALKRENARRKNRRYVYGDRKIN